jgi:hypothetical protein
MTLKQASSFFSMGKRMCVLLIAAAAVATPAAAFAMDATDATASERAACTPDVFRLCSSEIPSVNRIVACMVAKKDRLSPPCKRVFARRARDLKSAQNSQ